MVQYTGVNHLAMVTGDMDATVRFWRDLLGMRLVVGLGHPGYRHYFFELTGQDMIAFFEWDGVEPLPEKDHGVPVRGPVAFDHLSLGVASDEDLWQLKDRMEAAGIWVSEVVDHGFIRSIYAFDPNGIPIEFSAAEPNVDIRRYPAMTDLQPTKTAQEGANPVAGVWPEVKSPTPQDERVAYEGEGAAVIAEVKRRMAEEE